MASQKKRMTLKKSRLPEKQQEKKENIKIIREFVNTPFKEIKTEKKDTPAEEELEEEYEEDFYPDMPFFRRRPAQATPQVNLEQAASTAPAPVKNPSNGENNDEKPFSYTGSPVGYAALGYEPKTETQKTRQETWSIKQEGRMEADTQLAQQVQYGTEKEEDKGSAVVRKKMF